MNHRGWFLRECHLGICLLRFSFWVFMNVTLKFMKQIGRGSFHIVSYFCSKITCKLPWTTLNCHWIRHTGSCLLGSCLCWSCLFIILLFYYFFKIENNCYSSSYSILIIKKTGIGYKNGCCNVLRVFNCQYYCKLIRMFAFKIENVKRDECFFIDLLRVCSVVILGSSFSIKSVFEKRKKVFGKI